MPPKKLTKREQKALEKEQKLQEERERQQKIEAEKEEQRKREEEEERKRRVEEELFNAAEKERLKVEEKDFFQYENTLKNAIKRQLEKFDAEQEWKKYLLDPSHLNTNDPKQMAHQINKLRFAFKEISRKFLSRNREKA